MRSLEEELSSDPSSVSTWLSLLSLSLSQVPAASKNASKVRSEMTLSILSRALPTLPKGPSSTRLQLMYLHAGEELWTNEKLRNEWEKALTARDINIALAWLDWQIRNGSNGVEGVFEAANRVLTFASSESENLRVFWRLTCVLCQAGMLDFTSSAYEMLMVFQGSPNDPWHFFRRKQTCISICHVCRFRPLMFLIQRRLSQSPSDQPDAIRRTVK